MAARGGGGQPVFSARSLVQSDVAIEEMKTRPDS